MAAFPESCVDATVLDFVADLSLASPGHPLLCDLTPRVPYGNHQDLVLRDGRPRSLARFEEEDPEEEEGEGRKKAGGVLTFLRGSHVSSPGPQSSSYLPFAEGDVKPGQGRQLSLGTPVGGRNTHESSSRGG